MALIVQSKRKETKEERDGTDTELFADYKRAIWDHRFEYQAKKIFPVFLYLTDASSVFEGDEGTYLASISLVSQKCSNPAY